MALRQLAPLALQQLPKALAAQTSVASRSLRTSAAPRYHYVRLGLQDAHAEALDVLVLFVWSAMSAGLQLCRAGRSATLAPLLPSALACRTMSTALRCTTFPT